MKKTISILLIIVFVLFSFTACLDSSGDTDQGKGNADSGDKDSDFESSGETSQGTGSADKSDKSSNLGDYNVVIDGCRLTEDYKGAPVIVVRYVFTNHDDEPTAFMWAVDAEAYQDGVGLNECYVLDDSDDYSSDNQSKEIKKGVTLSVEVAYELNDVTTDVEIEVSELISWDDTKITRTFSIK